MEDLRKKMYTVLQIIIVSLCVYLSFKYLLPVFLPFIMAYALYRIIRPAIVFLYEKMRIPVVLSSILILSSATLMIASALIYFGKYILKQIYNIVNDISIVLDAGQILFLEICEYIGDILKCEPADVYQWFCSSLGEISKNIYIWVMEILSASGITLIKSSFLSVIIVLISLLSTILLVKNIKSIDRQIQKSQFSADIFEISTKVWDVVSCFVKTQAAIIAVISIICCIGLAFSGIKYFLIIGIAIGILDALPVIGSGTILIPWAIVCFIQSDYKTGIILLAVYGLCSVVRELLEAKMMGCQLGVNEFYMLMATFVGIKLFGFFGIILGPLGLILILEILRMLSTYLKMDSNARYKNERHKL